jgi:uncharacterized protein YlxW (UPF0749 family)
MSKDSFFKDDDSKSMGLLAMLNSEIETDEYTNPNRPPVGKKDPKWWIAVVLSFSGLLFGIAVANTQRQQPILEKNREDLRTTITKNIDNLNKTSEDLSSINNEIAQIQTNTPGLNFHGISQSNESNLQVFSGLSSVMGEGIEIVINDDVLATKIVDSLTLDQFTSDSNGNAVRDTFDTIIGTTETQGTGSVSISQQNLITNPVIPANTVIARYLESRYNIPIPNTVYYSLSRMTKIFT